MNHEVLFTPYVTVEVAESGEIVGATVDWSDTLRNDYQDGREVWTEGDDIEPPTAKAASNYLDNKVVRERVLAALQPGAATTAITSLIKDVLLSPDERSAEEQLADIATLLGVERPSASTEGAMVIAYAGEAGESFDNQLDRMKGYGVTITRVDGSEVEAVLVGSDPDAGFYGTVRYLPVEDGDYPSAEEIASDAALQKRIVSEVVRRVEVS